MKKYKIQIRSQKILSLGYRSEKIQTSSWSRLAFKRDWKD